MWWVVLLNNKLAGLASLSPYYVFFSQVNVTKIRLCWKKHHKTFNLIYRECVVEFQAWHKSHTWTYSVLYWLPKCSGAEESYPFILLCWFFVYLFFSHYLDSIEKLWYSISFLSFFSRNQWEKLQNKLHHIFTHHIFFFK